MKTIHGRLEVYVWSEHTSSYTVCNRFDNAKAASKALGTYAVNEYSGKYNFHINPSTPPWDAASEIIEALERLLDKAEGE